MVDDYTLQVADRLAAVLSQPNSSLESISRRMQGTPPELIVNLDPSLLSRFRPQGPPRCIDGGSAQGFAVHPLDYAWTFTAETSRALGERCANGARCLWLGMPSVVRWLAENRSTTTGVLVDRSPLVEHQTLLIERQTEQIRFEQRDLSGEPAQLSSQGFDRVFADPPWYPEHMHAWLSFAFAHCRVGTFVHLVVWPRLTRPGADRERVELLTLLSRVGVVTTEEEVIEYRVPEFEQMRFRRVGLGELGSWRVADLWTVAVRSPGAWQAPPNGTALRRWRRYLIGQQQVALRLREPDVVASPSLAALPSGATVASYSRRDSDRSEIELWLSNGYAFRVRGWSAFKDALDLMSGTSKRPSDRRTDEAMVALASVGLDPCDHQPYPWKVWEETEWSPGGNNATNTNPTI